MLKVFLSGHTKGLGAEIFRHLESSDRYQVIGGSRSNGFDISTSEGRSKVVASSETCDVIILCAHSNFSQSKLLFELFERYRTKENSIIVIGSLSSKGIKNFSHPYAIEKMSLKGTCEQLQNCHSNLSISLLSPGWIEVPRTLKLTDEPKLRVSDLLKAIDFILSLGGKATVLELAIEAKTGFSPEHVIENPWRGAEHLD